MWWLVYQQPQRQILTGLYVLAGLDLCLTLYSVVPTEQDRGVIEFIQEAETICRIQMAESCKNATGDISM